MSAKVEKNVRPDGTDHLVITPAPAIMVPQVGMKRREMVRFVERGSIVNIVAWHKARGLKVVLADKQTRLQAERELRALGKWDELKDWILEDSYNG